MLLLWQWLGACTKTAPIWFVLLGIMLGLSDGLTLAADAETDVFAEAQRHHLGVDTPVDYRRAYELYQEIVRRNPGHKDAYYNMAHICFEQKRYDLAANYYRRVLQLDPRDADAHNNLGTVYLRQGKLDAARKAYLDAVRINRDLAPAYYNLALIFMEEGDPDRAEKAIDEAVRIAPDNAEFVRLRSVIQGETGKISNALALVVVGVFVGVIVGYYFLFARKGLR